MTEDGFDTTELDGFISDMMDLAQEKLPKESKKYIKKEGNKLKNKIKKKAKEVGIPQNGSTGFYNDFKTGKVYKYEGALSVRAYNKNPVAHLLENGHRQVVGKKPNTRDTRKFVKGKFYTEKATQEFKPTYYGDSEKWIDKMLKEKNL